MNKDIASESLINLLDQNVFVKDVNLNYLFCNDAYAELLKIRPNMIMGKNDFDFFPKELAQQYRSDDQRILNGELRVEVVEDMIFNGERRIVKKIKKPLRSQNEVIGVIGIFWDITEQYLAGKELKEGFNNAQSLGNIGHWEIDRTKKRFYCSDQLYQIFGRSPKEGGVTYEAFLEHIHPDDFESVKRAYRKSLDEMQDYALVHRIVQADGSIRYVQRQCKHQFDSEGRVIYSIGTLQDVTKRHESDQELLLAANVFKNMSDGILITDAQHRIAQVNEAFCRMSGYTLEELKGKNPSLLSSGWHDHTFYEQMWQSLEEKGCWSGEIWDRKKGGELYTVELSISVIHNEAGEVTNYIAISSDITEKKEREEIMQTLAYCDSLTKLRNRTSFKDHVECAIDRNRAENEQFAILFFDLDNFKQINDSMGHLVGDMLLQAVANGIKDLLREDDFMARFGGDEFTIMVEHFGDISELEAVARKVIAFFTKPICFKGYEIHSGTSIGISVYPEDGTDFDTLMKAADAAMYHVKERGKNNYKFYTEEMNDKAVERLRLEHDLKDALAKGQLYVAYQPKVDTRTDTIYGMEALVRWRHPELGLVDPEKFISVAEESGQIHQLGLWVAESACKDALQLHHRGCEDLVVSINISPTQLKHNSFVDEILGVVADSGIEPGHVELEITEGCFMRNVEHVVKKLHRLNDAGLKLAIDDFGTGYSSLGVLKNFPIHTLKIDKRFILDMVDTLDNRNVAMAVIALARSMNFDVIAEGSETQEHVDTLRELDCHRTQGYFYGKPMELEEFFKYMRDFKENTECVISTT